MNPILSKEVGAVRGWAADGPWRSKSVLVAVVAILVGGAAWFSDVKKAAPQNMNANAVTNAQATMSTGAGGATGGAQWNWHRPLPIYVPVCISYVAGFCIGWFFRKLLHIVVVVVALIVGLLALGKHVGWDTTAEQEKVKHGGEWVQHEVTATENYLRHLLPSAAGGGAGAFFGFRRRSRGTPTTA
jgi:uncharacterized membrane protein (Fun14 family)